MYRMTNLQLFVSLLLVMTITFVPAAPPMAAAPQDHGGSPGDLNRTDPCTVVPNPPGKAIGIATHCPPRGSSSGIVKGDFNGDGFADLAIGEPGANIGSARQAGDVVVVYGSANGLTT